MSWPYRARRRALARAAASCALVAVLALLAGCRAGPGQPGAARTGPTAASAIPVGSSTHSIAVGGTTRTYIVYRPADLPASAPLVVMLHGGYGSASQAERSYHWDAEADAGHFLVAYPDGLDRAWNTGGGCCGAPGRAGADDVGFITAMVSAISRALPVDASRVYATGISNGGIMAYTLACRTTVFAAIGPDSATQLGGCQHPVPVSVIAIHGTADHNIPYNGGPGDGTARIDGPPVPAVNAGWRRVDQCAPPVASVAGPVTDSVAKCPAGRDVELVTIAGAGHQWPGATAKPALQKLLRLDPPSTALDATAVIWRFFAAHPASPPAAGR